MTAQWNTILYGTLPILKKMLYKLATRMMDGSYVSIWDWSVVSRNDITGCRWCVIHHGASAPPRRRASVPPSWWQVRTRRYRIIRYRNITQLRFVPARPLAMTLVNYHSSKFLWFACKVSDKSSGYDKNYYLILISWLYVSQIVQSDDIFCPTIYTSLPPLNFKSQL